MEAEVVVDGGLDEEARGVAHDAAGGEVRLPGVLPGERVVARITHRAKKGGRSFGVPVRIVEPSAERKEAGCPRFLDCGGCDLLHASQVAQHAFKRDLVARALDVELERVDAVIASPRELGYRALVKLVVGPDLTLGSYRPRSHDVVDMRGCIVHAPEAERIADAAREALIGLGTSGDLRYVLVRASLSEGRSVVTLVARSTGSPIARKLARQLATRSDVARIVLKENRSEGDVILGDGPEEVLHDAGRASEEIGPIVQTLDSGAFAQINPLAAAALYAEVARAIEPAGRRVLDLYSGSGGIALTLAKAGAASVTAVEASEEAADAARRSVSEMGLDQIVQVMQDDVAAALPELPEADAIVLNPPRKGASRAVLEAIAERRPVRLVYVSCNPQTLARDVEVLRSLAEIEIRRITPVDLFPQTRHVETVLSLDLR